MLLAFPSPLIPGRLVQRYKRFLADVRLDGGDVVTAHCCNPGAMTGLAEPGSRVWLSHASNPARKLRYSWELVEVADGVEPTLVGINTIHPNAAVASAIAQGLVPGLGAYETVKREVRYGQGSRVDFLLQAPDRPSCYLEVKNVHLMRKPGLAEFPDSVTARGRKHLQELADMVRAGHRAVMLFFIQRGDAEAFCLARDIDPAYGAAFAAALEAGVEAIALASPLSTQGLHRPRAVPLVPDLASTDRPLAVAQGHISP